MWLHRRSVLGLITTGMLALSVTPSPVGAQPPPKGCQDQICVWSGQCYGCNGYPGFYCSPELITCPRQCTEGRCDEGLSASDCERQVQMASLLQFVAAQYTTVPGGTVMTFLAQQGQPVALTEVTFASTNVFGGGLIRNFDQSDLIGIRLGRLLLHASGGADLHVGDPITLASRVPGGGGTLALGEQPMFGSTYDLGLGTAKVIFFVAEAEFIDRRIWKADLEKVLADGVGSQKEASPAPARSRSGGNR